MNNLEEFFNELRGSQFEAQAKADAARVLFGRKNSVDYELAMEFATDVEEIYTRYERAKALIDFLPDCEMKLIFDMRFLQGESWGYIEDAMHMSKTTVWRIYRKGLEILSSP